MNNTIEQPPRKTGRPALHEGIGRVTVTLGETRRQRLVRFCAENKLTMNEVLRRLIDAIKDEPE